MSPLEKNLQRFFIYFFSAISFVIITIGTYRVKNPPSLGEAPTPTPPDATGGSETLVNGVVASFTGKTYQTPFGNVVAAIKVKDGKIVAVTMPIVPNSSPSVYAEPYLIDQALKAGSANIQGVSGATYTSLAFKSSLESAISQAQAQGQQVASRVTTPNSPANTPASVPKTANSNTTISHPTTASTDATVLSFTGKTYSTPFGDASAAIKIKGGTIIEVTMPKVPNSPPSLYAQPYLIDQALKAGSANIQGVSGATYTSLAFKSSLESAISQAQAKGQTVTAAAPSTGTPTPAPSVPRQYSDDD
jgi:uncharacterized protein with FMN-binding domain